jgi:two-component system, chemotaxis family, chemotaxis protein CheY
MSATKRILFVDDDDTIREFVSMALTDEGYEVVTAPHGAAALESLARKMPALILLDMRMPIMDGWSFLKAYQQLPSPLAPVIALTASRNISNNQIPPEVSGFLAKPFDLDELINLVDEFVQTAPPQ